MMPWCDTHAMTEHLAEISRQVAHSAHAVLILDQAGWHMTDDLSPVFPPAVGRIRMSIYGLMRPAFPEPFSWRIRRA